MCVEVLLDWAETNISGLRAISTSHLGINQELKRKMAIFVEKSSQYEQALHKRSNLVNFNPILLLKIYDIPGHTACYDIIYFTHRVM